MMFRGSSVVVLLSYFLLCSCGGGGGDGGSNGPPAPSALSYPTPPAFVVTQAITALSPTVTGMVSSYSVNPALPAGLTMSTGTGVISGTPTTVTSGASYTVQASNSGGNTTATITLTVNDAAPAISYGGTNFAITAQKPMNLTPMSSGGAVITWSINPALPAGLTFSTTNGSIAGTPTAPAAAASYIVTAQNSGGQTNVTLTLGVQSVLLNLGHSGDVTLIRLGNSRVLSQDGFHTWVLWNAATAATVATGAGNCLQPGSNLFPCLEPKVDMAGSVVAIEKTGALEIRSASSGSLVATVSDSSLTWWRLAADGSYLSAGGPNGLKVWSPTGTVVTSRDGNYASAVAFAAPNELRVARGPAGASVIETISLPSGTSSTGPAFQGEFDSWFQDGERYLTRLGSTVWVFSADSTQEDIRVLPTLFSLTGQGDWFWTYDGTTIAVYKVGASAAPAGTFLVGHFASPTPSGMTIGALEDVSGPMSSVTGVVHIIDLSGTSPVMADHATAANHNSAYGAISSTQWLVGNQSGTLLDGASLGGTLRYFGYGRATSIAASAQRVAVATAVGKIVFFDVATGALEGTLDSPGSELALSADGSTLVAGTTEANGAIVQVYSLPSGTLTYSWPPASVLSFVLSGSGTALGQVLQTCGGGGSCTETRQVTPTTGGAATWSDVTNGNPLPEPIRLSPDGTVVAVSSSHGPGATTNLFHNGTLVTAIAGWAVGWLDDTHLLVQNYEGGPGYVGSAIYDPSGIKLSTPAARDVGSRFQVAGPDSIYDFSSNKIFSVSTGAAIWTTPTPTLGVGAAAGSHVVFASGSQVISQQF